MKITKGVFTLNDLRVWGSTLEAAGQSMAAFVKTCEEMGISEIELPIERGARDAQKYSGMFVQNAWTTLYEKMAITKTPETKRKVASRKK